MAVLPTTVTAGETATAVWANSVRAFLQQAGPGRFSAPNQLLAAANAAGDTKVIAVGSDGQVLGVSGGVWGPVDNVAVAALPAGADDQLLVYNGDTNSWVARSLNGFPIQGLGGGGFVYFRGGLLRFRSTTTTGVGSDDGDHPQLLSGEMVWGAPALGFFSGTRTPTDSQNPDISQLTASPQMSSYLQEVDPPAVWHKTGSPNTWVKTFVFPAAGGGVTSAQVNAAIETKQAEIGLILAAGADTMKLVTDGTGSQSALPYRGFDVYTSSPNVLPANSVGVNGDISLRSNGSVDRKINGAWGSYYSAPGASSDSIMAVGTDMVQQLVSAANVRAGVAGYSPGPSWIAGSPSFFSQLQVKGDGSLGWFNPRNGQVLGASHHGLWQVKGGVQTLLAPPTVDGRVLGYDIASGDYGWTVQTGGGGGDFNIHGLPLKHGPSLADEWAIVDDADANALKRTTGAGIVHMVESNLSVVILNRLLPAHPEEDAGKLVAATDSANGYELIVAPTAPAVSGIILLGPDEDIPDATEAQYDEGAVLFRGGVEYAVGKIVGPPVGEWTFATLTSAQLSGYKGVTFSNGSLYDDYPVADQETGDYVYIRQSRRWVVFVPSTWALTNSPTGFVANLTSEDGIRQAHETTVGAFYFDLSYELVRYISAYDAQGGDTPVIGYYWVASGGGPPPSTGRYITDLGQLTQDYVDTTHLGRRVSYSRAPTPVTVVEPVFDDVPKNLRVDGGNLKYNSLGPGTEVDLGAIGGGGGGGVTASDLAAAIETHKNVSAAHHTIPTTTGVSTADLDAAIETHKNVSAAHHTIPTGGGVTTAALNAAIETHKNLSAAHHTRRALAASTTTPERSAQTGAPGAGEIAAHDNHRHQGPELAHVGGVAGAIAGLWLGSQVEYDAISGHDTNTVYFVR